MIRRWGNWRFRFLRSPTAATRSSLVTLASTLIMCLWFGSASSSATGTFLLGVRQ